MPSEPGVAGGSALPKGESWAGSGLGTPCPCLALPCPALNTPPLLPYFPGVFGSCATGRFLAGRACLRFQQVVFKLLLQETSPFPASPKSLSFLWSVIPARDPSTQTRGCWKCFVQPQGEQLERN